MPTLEIPYKPRDQFKPYHKNEKRFAVSVCHRRAGKSVARINRLIRAAITQTRTYPPGRYGFVAPYRRQAKELIWLYALHYCDPLVRLGAKVNVSELSITFAHNQASITLYGAENSEALRGLYFDGLVLDECQGTARSVLSTVILPCLADYKGWLDAAGTPRGWTNLLGELVKIARERPQEWFLQILRASESGILSDQELALQKSLMSDNEYEQEYECSFDAAITGAVYGAQIAQADKNGRLLDKLTAIPDEPVHTAWDLGYDDATAIWWFQVLKSEIRILDYYESNGEPISHYCEIVKYRGLANHWRYGKHYVPHDAAHELLAAGGRSIVQQAYGFGIQMFVVPATTQQNGIEALRKTLERCWFDRDRCEQGIEALRQYQFEFDTDKKTYRSKPRHDWASHGADAAEIIGQVWRQPIEPPKPAKPRFLHEAKANELFWPEKQRNQIERI